VRTESDVSGRHIGRYVLEDLVAENAGTALWRATDPALQRPVGARLIPLSDPRVEALRAAALCAASIHDRRLVRVLDVVQTDDQLGIVTEWVNGHSWSELLNERWSPQEATVVALEVGRALESAHRAGVSHGRIRPDSVMITDTREVRLRGLGVEAALWGVEPPGDPRAADLHGIGALLYAGLTRRWPTIEGSKLVDGIDAAPLVDHRVVPPSTLSPDVPRALDTIVGRSLANGTPGPGVLPFPSVTECVQDLERAFSHVPATESDAEFAEGTDSATDRLLGRIGTVAVIALAVAGVALLMWQLLANRVSEPSPANAGPASIAPIEPLAGPGPEAPFPIVRAKDFDPQGDGTENPETVKDAIDKDRDSAWFTGGYENADMSPKEGVGVLLDLGVQRPVRAIDLKLVGTGTDFQILTAKDKPKNLGDLRKVVEVTGAGDAIRVRTPRAIDARYVLVWLTRLPFDGESYSGGVRLARVVG
jgi:Protein kinase domain